MVELAAIIINFVLKCCKFISDLQFTYLPIRHIAFAVAIFVSAVLVSLCYLAFKRVKPAVIFGTVICCTVFIGYSVFTHILAKETFVHLLSDGKEYACVVHKGNRATVISSNGGFSEEVDKIFARQGITQVDIFISLDNGPHSYGSYSKFSPRQMLLPEPTYIFEPEIPYSVFYDEMEIKLPYAEVFVSQGDCKIAFENTEIVFGEELYDAENSASVFAGITGITLNGSKPEIYLNGCNLCFKVTEKGLLNYPWLK